MGLRVLVLISRGDDLDLRYWHWLIGEVYRTMGTSNDLKGGFGSLGTSNDL